MKFSNRGASEHDIKAMKSLKSLILTTMHLLFLQLVGSALSAQTVVGGDILTNTTYTQAGSPYLVTTNLRVVQGVTLTVQPGVILRFAAQVRLDVEGHLEAVGTALDSVLFSTSVAVPDTGSWAGIWVAGSVGGRANLDYAKIAYASTALGLTGTAVGNSLVLDHSEIRTCAKGLQDWQGAALSIRNCGFKENQVAVQSSDLSFRRCAFAANALGIVGGSSDVDSCTFTKHQVAAFQGGGGQVRGSLFVSNTIGLLIYGFTPNDSVNGCQFAENDTAAVATGSGATFFGNEFCANSINVRASGLLDPAFAGNCWCSIDTSVIVNTLVDGRSNAQLGTVQIAPIDTNCQVITQVWPGDINDDGVATIADVLYLGVAYGKAGPTRADATASWSGQAGLPWDLSYDSGTNFKHADCDGDGFVGLNDTLPIVQNLGQVHYKTHGTDGSGGIPVIFTLPATAAPGDTIMMDVAIGDAQHPAAGIYGLSFVLRPDTAVYRPQMQTDLNGTWLGTPGSDLMDLDVQDGKLHWGVVRTDQQDVSGVGRMGGVTLLLIDDLTRMIPVDSSLVIEDVVLIDKKGNPLETDVQIIFVHPCSGMQVAVCPTMANARIQVLLDTLVAQSVELFDQTGHLAFRTAGNLSGAVEIDARQLQPGMYFVRVTLQNGVLNRKVFVIR
jgi:hypothetical protein